MTYNWHRDSKHVPAAEALRIEHKTKSGKATILLREAYDQFSPGGMRFAVTALDGHELLPVTRHFNDLDEAKTYANWVWARY